MTEYEMQSNDGNDEFKHSGEYTTYDGPDTAEGPAVKGFNFLTSVAEQAGRFVTLTLDPEGDDVSFEKATTRTAKYAGPGVRSLYITHEEMAESLGATEGEDGEMEFPESLGLSVAPSDESAFETAADEREAAENLLAGMGDSDAVEAEEDESDESDEEAEAESLLAEAEEAAE